MVHPAFRHRPAWPPLLAAGAALLLSLVLSGAWSRARAAQDVERFVVCYGEGDAPEAFAPYRRAVLDGDHHPPLAPLKARGIELFGYVSLGEAEAGRPYYPAAERAGVLLGANPDWPGARYVDLRDPAWQALVLDRLIPAVLAQGFDGLFLDTLDDAATLERADPARHRGMVDAAAALVRAIRARYPAVPLMLNRAYEVGVLVAPALDSVLAESLSSTYDFKSRRYRLRGAADLEWGLARIAELRRANPGLRVYALDYWALSDHAGVARLYARERRAGFVPYVAAIDLQRVAPEPPHALARRSSR